MSKRGDIEWDWIVHVAFYLGLLIVVGAIIYLVITGKFNSLWQSIVEVFRFG